MKIRKAVTPVMPQKGRILGLGFVLTTKIPTPLRSTRNQEIHLRKNDIKCIPKRFAQTDLSGETMKNILRLFEQL
jgi:hypothetical protein